MANPWDNDPIVQAAQSASPWELDPEGDGGWSAASEAQAIEAMQQPGAFSDASASAVARGIPFADEIVGGMQAPIRAVKDWVSGDGFDLGRSYDRSVALERELQRRREERSPIASTAGSIVGGVAASAPLAKAGVSFLNGAKPTLGSLMGRGAAEGAAYGAVYGAGEGDNLNDRAWNAVTQAGTGAVIGGATGALARPAASKVDLAGLPSADDLRLAAQNAYQQADDAGVVFSGNAAKRIYDDLVGQYADFGYHPELQPRAGTVLKEIDRLQGGNVTLKGLDTARKIASNAYDPTNKSSNALTTKAINAIDDLVQNPRAGELVAGDAGNAADALKEARGLYQQSAKLEKVQKMLRDAGLDTASSGSGGNIENNTRRELKKLLKNPKMTRGFTAEELAAVKEAVLGTPTQNILRQAGKMSPEGNGLTMMLHLLGGSATGGATLPLAAAGMGAKRLADGMAANKARAVEAIIAGGGKALPKGDLSPVAQAVYEAIVRGGGQIPAPMSRN